MLKYILGIPEPEDYDPFEIISAMDTGTLAHSLMEALGGEAMDAGAFREKRLNVSPGSYLGVLVIGG